MPSHYSDGRLNMKLRRCKAAGDNQAQVSVIISAMKQWQEDLESSA